jgi:antitoxin component YwqK of YwqJK toxin-antitoxin module
MTQKINQTDSQGRKQGPWVETDRERFTYKGHYVNGLKEGVWEGYRPDGTLWQRGHFHHGEKHGTLEYYHPDGTLEDRGHYHHGKPHGVWESYRTDGTLEWRGHYHHDEQHGVWEWYYPDGTLHWRTHYHHGTPIREDTDKTLDSYNTIIHQQGLSTWLSIPTDCPDCLLFLSYTNLI